MAILPYLIVGPLIFLIGLITWLKPPRKINLLYGYRTTRSMRDQPSWDFAQKFSSRLFMRAGIALAVIGVILHVFFNLQPWLEALLAIVFLLGSMAAVIIMVEKQLQRKQSANE